MNLSHPVSVSLSESTCHFFSCIAMSSSSLKHDIVSIVKTARLTRESLDENSRVQALSAARELVQTLSSPAETAIQDVSMVCEGLILHTSAREHAY